MADYSDLDRQIEQLKRCEIIRETEVKALCAKAREILVEEGNVQRVDSPVTVSPNICFKFFFHWFERKKLFGEINERGGIIIMVCALLFSFYRYVAIFMANFMISKNCLKSAAMCPKRTTCLWAILLIAAITV